MSVAVNTRVLWMQYEADNRRSHTAYLDDPLALSKLCDSDEQRKESNAKTARWERSKREGKAQR